jgi:hypothetical protein
MKPGARAAFIDQVLANAKGFEHTADERKAMLFGYVIGLSVALGGDLPYAKAEYASRREQLKQFRDGDT